LLLHKDLLTFLRENNFPNLTQKELKLIFPKEKTSYIGFVKKLLNFQSERDFDFFNKRNVNKDVVIRKIDRLSHDIEHKFSHFINHLIQLHR
jgi:hypothetical protein